MLSYLKFCNLVSTRTQLVRRKRSLAQMLTYTAIILGANLAALAHDASGTATYVANESVLITTSSHKILFDPFFHNDFGYYQLVSPRDRKLMLENKAPFDNLTAIVISHAHEDHFDAKDVVNYLSKYPKVKLYAPRQAIKLMTKLSGFNSIA
ncbi:MAG: MBL fold metallo-hydrolase, partial [Kangiellaceae bacterium]|nr:MBL fold metallo-hydrolase [Kangiellaceae bacterium]